MTWVRSRIIERQGKASLISIEDTSLYRVELVYIYYGRTTELMVGGVVA